MATINNLEDELIELSTCDIIINNNNIKHTQDNSKKSSLYHYIENDMIREFRHYITKNKSILNKIIDHKYLISEACRLGKPEFVTFLIFMGCVMKKDKKGNYPQHYSVLSGKSILLDIMAMFGVNFNVVDSEGNTPLHHAVRLRNMEMIRTLINYGVRTNIRNKNGLLPIDLQKNDQQIIHLINKK